jgi:hypothetical protein
LLLQASLDGGSVQLKLAEHQGILETVLATHLGHKTVEVLGVWKHSRRLHAGDAHAEHLKIKFVARNKIMVSSSTMDLRQALQDAFDKVLVGMTFQSASTSWGWELPAEESATERASDDCGNKFPVIPVVCAAMAVCFLGLGFCMWSRGKKRDASKRSVPKTITPDDVNYDIENHSCEKKVMTENKFGDSEEVDVEIASFEKKEMTEKKFRDTEEVDVEIASASTGTPGSGDDIACEDVVTPSDSLQQEPDVVVTGKVAIEI